MPLVQPMVAALGLVYEVTGASLDRKRVELQSERTGIESQMPAISTTAVASQHERPAPSADDILTICAISIVAGVLTNILHEGVGHGLVALLTGAKSGVLTTVAWSSAFDSRLVAAGGTLVNLAAALVFWLALRSAKHASMAMRY